MTLAEILAQNENAEIITDSEKLQKIFKRFGLDVEDCEEVTGAIILNTEHINTEDIMLTEDINPESLQAEFDMIDFWM